MAVAKDLKGQRYKRFSPAGPISNRPDFQEMFLAVQASDLNVLRAKGEPHTDY